MPGLPPPTSPRLIIRVLSRVATGLRRPRAVAEALDVEVREVEAALDTAEWLGLLRAEPEASLTPEGLALCYAGRRRPAVYAEVVRSHPVLGPLVPARGAPDLLALIAVVRARSPGLAPTAARASARALRRLILPALRVAPSEASSRQIGIAFGAIPLPRKPRLDLRAGIDDNPDVYTFVLRLLLDHGELSPSQLRGALDAEGGASCGLGGYLAMATRRGDARRVGDILVVTRGAVARAELAESPVTVALSDPDFRAWLAPLLAGSGTVSGRFRPWVARLWPGWDTAGPNLAAHLRAGLDRVLFGRPLATLPVADSPGDPLPVEAAPFLSVATRRNLVLAFPSDLSQLAGGLAATNRSLRAAAVEAASVRPPSPADRRVVVHGGLLHPGEPAVRGVPDGVTLRLRAATRVPGFSLLLALGVLDRRGAVSLEARGGTLRIASSTRARLVDATVTDLATARGWTLVRGPTSASWLYLADLAEQLGLLTRLGDRYTLDEGFFLRLQTDPEHREVWDQLQPLAELLLDRVSTPLGG